MEASARLFLVACIVCLSTQAFGYRATPWDGMGVTCQPDDVMIDVTDEQGCFKYGVEIKYCRGTCRSATGFQPQYPYFNPICECCKATKFAMLDTSLVCPDGSVKSKKVRTVQACKCSMCTT